MKDLPGGREALNPEFSPVTLAGEPLDVGRCVQSGQTFRWSRGEDGVWRGADGDAWFEVREDGGLAVRTNDRRAFSRLFRTAESGVWAEVARRGPELAPALQEMAGLRVLRQDDAVEALFAFLCTPNNHMSRIVPMVNHLASFGGWLANGVRRFPDLPVLAGLSEASLRAVGFGYRGATIPAAAREVLARGGRAWLEGLRSATWSEARRELIALPGVGPKVADCVALFGLHHGESAPIDTHVYHAMASLYFPAWRGLPLSDARYREASAFLRDRFGDLAGEAQQVLFYGRWAGSRPPPCPSAGKGDRGGEASGFPLSIPIGSNQGAASGGPDLERGTEGVRAPNT